VADKKKNDGYFALVDKSAQKARERGYPLNQNNVTGLGTIYSWDFAFVAKKSIQESPVSRGEADTMYFRYIGQAAQVNTTKRISEHVSAAKGGGSDKTDRKMYAALGTALKDDYRKQNKFPETSTISTADNNNIVKVVHVASLFDLAALESYMINQDKLTEPEFNSFDDIIQKRGLIGLNTLASGVNAAVAGSKSAGEIISAAFFFLTEDDNTILAARDKDVQMPVASDILSKYSNNYIEATKEVFKHFQIDKKYQTDSSGFNDMLENFYKKVGSRFQAGLQLNKDGMVDISAKFGNPELQVFFTYVDVDTQIVKGITFKMAMSKDTITSSDMKALAKEAEIIQKEKISKTAMVKKIADIYKLYAKKAGAKTKTKQKVEKPQLDVITQRITSILQKQIDSSVKVDKEKIFSGRALQRERLETKAGNLTYIADEDQDLLTEIIAGFSYEYYKVMGILPTDSEISGIIGFFAQSNVDVIEKTLIDKGTDPKLAASLAKQMVVRSKWTTKPPKAKKQ
jgi:hypothetical protein